LFFHDSQYFNQQHNCYDLLPMMPVDPIQNISHKDRLRGAVWGQFVGDAAALGSHWIYDLAELQQIYPGGVHGFEAPKEGHYHFGKQPGDQTHYGDGALVLLESLAKEGKFDERAFGQRFVEVFRPGTYSGYIDKATKGTFETFKAFAKSNPVDDFDFQHGADDDHLAAASRLAALVVRYNNDPDLLRVVERTTRVCQNSHHTVAYMKFNALLLSELLDGNDVQTSLRRAEERIVAVEPQLSQEIRRKTGEASEQAGKDVIEATLTFGQACPLPKSFPSSIHVLLKHPDDFKSAILATLRASGDSAGRASMIGAWLGAHLGIAAVPKAWRLRLSYADRISTATEKILANLRGPFRH
jgi:ADP-ribosyl-[dinitrogen reductase] hydrolase